MSTATSPFSPPHLPSCYQTEVLSVSISFTPTISFELGKGGCPVKCLLSGSPSQSHPHWSGKLLKDFCLSSWNCFTTPAVASIVVWIFCPPRILPFPSSSPTPAFVCLFIWMVGLQPYSHSAYHGILGSRDQYCSPLFCSLLPCAQFLCGLFTVAGSQRKPVSGT